MNLLLVEKESSWSLPCGTEVPISRCPGLESREKPLPTGLGRSVLNPPLSESAGSSSSTPVPASPGRQRGISVEAGVGTSSEHLG